MSAEPITKPRRPPARTIAEAMQRAADILTAPATMENIARYQKPGLVVKYAIRISTHADGTLNVSVTRSVSGNHTSIVYMPDLPLLPLPDPS